MQCLPRITGVSLTEPDRAAQVASFLLRVIAAGIAFWIGWRIGWGSPRWHSTISLAYVRNLRLPWPVWGCSFYTVATLVLFPGRIRWARLVRAAGWWLGAVVYGYFALSVVIAVWGAPTAANPVLIGAAVGWTVLQVFAATTAMDGD
jgi:hypothetical protein